MLFKSILYKDRQTKLQIKEPEFFHDLQLDYMLKLLNNMAKNYNIAPYFYTLPCDRDVISYRQEVYKDIMIPSLNKAIQTFSHKLQKAKNAYELSTQCTERLQADSYHLEAAIFYWDALCELHQSLRNEVLKSEGFLAFKLYIEHLVAHYKANGFEKAMRQAENFFEMIRFQIMLDPERITIIEESEEVEKEDYLKDLQKLLKSYNNEKEEFLPKFFPNDLEMSHIEKNLILLLNKINPDIFYEIQKFCGKYPDFMDKGLLTFAEEVQFYICFYECQKKTEQLGYSMNMPQITGEKQFEGKGLYDLALVWKNLNRDYQIITNDFSYSKLPAFFVVTGPNQGGKTTFARSMGQAIYFALMGLPVNASCLHMPFFVGLATHFEAEEQMQSNSGKLKEEIQRLTPMMQQEKTGQFVVLNELFTTATTYDAEIMGKKVMKHFLEADCCGIYVTHIQELAEESDSIISLVAQIEDDKQHRRTYRMLPMKAQGYGYSDSLVEEFELRYEDIIRRLS